MAMGPHLGFASLAERLPLLSGVRYWEKLAIWPTLFLCVAAGLGASRLLTEDGAARRLARRGGALAAALGLVAVGAGLLSVASWLTKGPDSAPAAELLAGNLAEGSLHAALLAALLAGVAWLVGEGRLDRLAPAALLLAIGADLLGANVRAYRLAEPPGPLPQESMGRRILAEGGLPTVVTPFALRPIAAPGLSPFESKWRRGALELYPAWNAALHARNSFPYSALQPGRYARFDELLPLETRVAALGTFGFQAMVVAGSPELLRRTALAPPWVVLVRDEPLDSVLVALPHRPRAYLASEARSVTPEEALAFAGDPAEAARRGAVVEGALPPALAGGEATVVRDDPEAVAVRTSSNASALLVLNDAFAAGWSARVDGRPAPILPANFAARGVVVEAGRHDVVFTYRTPGLALGWAIAGAALLLVAAFATRDARRRARGGS
jgi:hypothetical protein